MRSVLLVILSTASLSFFASAQNDLAGLSDEFDDAVSLSNWQRIHAVEGWNADQLETWDIDTTTPGKMTMMPYTSTWYEDYRGVMVFKEVSGDVVMTIDIEVSGRDGISVPESQYSLGGIMFRTPRNVTPGTWTPGGENYVFLSVGHGDNGGTAFQYEVKTTIASESTLVLSNAAGGRVKLQVARIGDSVITLRKPENQPWVVHARYTRTDFPETLQTGIVTYTNWEKASLFGPFDQNSNVLNPPLSITDPDPDEPFNPDLLARIDYARFFRPEVPAELDGLDLSNSGQVPDAQLLAFLGENADTTAAGEITSSNSGLIEEGDFLTLTGPAGSAHEWRKNDVDLSDDAPRLTGTTSETLTFEQVLESDSGVYTVSYEDGTKAVVTSAPYVLTVLPAGSLPALGAVALGLLAGALAALRFFRVVKKT